MTKTKAKLTDEQKQELVKYAWETGQLEYKIYNYQKPVYDVLWETINNPKGLKFYLNISRRWGKSTLSILVAIEYALRYPASQIRFVCPTQKALRKISWPIFQMLMRDCPEDLKPTFHQTDSVWTFHNGSQIHLAGVNGGQFDNLRGTAANLCVVDEAGFCDDLDTVVRSILIPQTLTTGGKTILASTPPTTPAHSSYSIAMECMADGFYKSFTVYDNKSLSADTIERYAKESGGFDSTTWKREYLVEWVVDQELLVLPEWSEKFIGEPERDNRYPYHHRYTSMELVVKGSTALLFGYYDHTTKVLTIQAESEVKGAKLTTQVLSQAITAKESELFDGSKPHRRLSDNKHPLLLADLGILHQLHFMKETDDIITLVNEARVMLLNERVRVNPECINLIANLKYGVWQENRKALGTSGAYNDFSHLKALLYMIRKIDEFSNPVPVHLNMNDYTYYIPNEKASSSEALKRMLGLTKR